MKKTEIPKCVVPDCENHRAAVGKRGANSPIVLAGGDKSKRSAFCRFHLKGKGKEARIAWQMRDKESAE